MLSVKPKTQRTLTQTTDVLEILHCNLLARKTDARRIVWRRQQYQHLNFIIVYYYFINNQVRSERNAMTIAKRTRSSYLSAP